MHLEMSQEHQDFREEVHTWIAENKPKGKRPDPADRDAVKAYDLGWQRTQFEGGWAGLNWPEEYGGRGLDIWRQLIWHEEYYEAGCDPGCAYMGLNHGGLTVAARGTDELKAYHLPKILKGEVSWCQGFSEPGAGSDLAGIKTRGVVDGDELVINGQKIWTSYARYADWQFVLVRTDPDAPRHKGLSWVINRMDNPGMDIRPILTMNDRAEFCEVFYDDVRVPLTNVVGGLNEGWGVTMATLQFEHGTSYAGHVIRLTRQIGDLIELAKDTTGPDGRRPAIAHDDIAVKLAEYKATAIAVRTMLYMNLSRSAANASGGIGPALSMMCKELSQKISRLSLEVLGAQSLPRSGTGEDWVLPYLSSFSATIAGGTSEILRNNVGRILGLPKG